MRHTTRFAPHEIRFLSQKIINIKDAEYEMVNECPIRKEDHRTLIKVDQEIGNQNFIEKRERNINLDSFGYTIQFGFVTGISLSRKTLLEIPRSVFDFSQLRSLMICNNALRSIPEDICRLTRLKRLWVVGNSLETLPLELCQLRYLEELVISGNQIKSLPSSLCSLPNLKSAVVDDWLKKEAVVKAWKAKYKKFHLI